VERWTVQWEVDIWYSRLSALDLRAKAIVLLIQGELPSVPKKNKNCRVAENSRDRRKGTSAKVLDQLEKKRLIPVSLLTNTLSVKGLWGSPKAFTIG